MEDLAPLGVWLQPDECCNGPSWVTTELNSLGFLFVRSGWKSLALARGLQDRHVIQFKFYGVATLFVKVFGSADERLDCCMEDRSGSSSADDSNNSSSPDGGTGDNDSAGSQGARMKEEADSD
ncbi:heat shock cognate 70 kda protein 1 [Hordeum vulgare]|nr:heat shock cognate 70 kda protein 1 [Hordeum vulgare]